MPLTGPGFLVLIIVLTLAAFVASVLLMPRMASQRPSALAARSATLLLVNVLVLLTATIALNDQFVFFADWTDLHGAVFGGQVAATKQAGTSAAAAASAPVPGQSPAPVQGQSAAAHAPGLPPLLPTGPLNADRVLRFTVTGAKSGLKGVVLISLPEGYTDAANATRRYPVLETLHGYPGDPSQWTDSMNLGSAIDTAVGKHQVGAMITVSPTIEFPPGVDTECVDGPGSAPKVETWLTEDVPTWVMQNFRVHPERSSWATIGLSAGAWCAAMATMLHPARYSAGIVMGGYFSPEFSKNYKPFGPKSAQGQRYDLVNLARQHPPSVALWVETSHSDSISFPSTSRLLAAARPPMSVQTLVLSHAGHRVSLWEGELPQVLSWLGKNIPGFAFTA